MNALQWFLLALAAACTFSIIRFAIRMRRTMKRIPRTTSCPRVSDMYTHSGVRPRRHYERHTPTKSHDVAVAPVDLNHDRETAAPRIDPWLGGGGRSGGGGASASWDSSSSSTPDFSNVSSGSSSSYDSGSSSSDFSNVSSGSSSTEN